MLKHILILFFVTLLLFSNGDRKQKSSPLETLELLEAVEEFAIVLGSGNKKIYSFVDPSCIVSRRYIKHLFNKEKKLFKRYSIHLFLYELKRLKSGTLIRNIFDNEFPDLLLKSIMVYREPFEIEDIDDEDIEERVKAIESVAEKIGVYKRPYIIINGRGK